MMVLRWWGYPRLLGCTWYNHKGPSEAPHGVGVGLTYMLEGWGAGPPLEGKAGEATSTHLTLVHS